MYNFIDSSAYKEFLILNGLKIEADKVYEKIFNLAKKSVIYIDDYIGLKTVDLLSFVSDKVLIIIISDKVSKPK